MQAAASARQLVEFAEKDGDGRGQRYVHAKSKFRRNGCRSFAPKLRCLKRHETSQRIPRME
jgi:hypothetical protein